jgi:hypothetical protein
MGKRVAKLAKQKGWILPPTSRSYDEDETQASDSDLLRSEIVVETFSRQRDYKVVSVFIKIFSTWLLI